MGHSGHAHFVASFKRGLEAHVQVRNALVMEMADDIALTGFTAACGG